MGAGQFDSRAGSHKPGGGGCGFVPHPHHRHSPTRPSPSPGTSSVPAIFGPGTCRINPPRLVPSVPYSFLRLRTADMHMGTGLGFVVCGLWFGRSWPGSDPVRYSGDRRALRIRKRALVRGGFPRSRAIRTALHSPNTTQSRLQPKSSTAP